MNDEIARRSALVVESSWNGLLEALGSRGDARHMVASHICEMCDAAHDYLVQQVEFVLGRGAEPQSTQCLMSLLRATALFGSIYSGQTGHRLPQTLAFDEAFPRCSLAELVMAVDLGLLAEVPCKVKGGWLRLLECQPPRRSAASTISGSPRVIHAVILAVVALIAVWWGRIGPQALVEEEPSYLFQAPSVSSERDNAGGVARSFVVEDVGEKAPTPTGRPLEARLEAEPEDRGKPAQSRRPGRLVAPSPDWTSCVRPMTSFSGEGRNQADRYHFLRVDPVFFDSSCWTDQEIRSQMVFACRTHAGGDCVVAERRIDERQAERGVTGYYRTPSGALGVVLADAMVASVEATLAGECCPLVL